MVYVIQAINKVLNGGRRCKGNFFFHGWTFMILQICASHNRPALDILGDGIVEVLVSGAGLVRGFIKAKNGHQPGFPCGSGVKLTKIKCCLSQVEGQVSLYVWKFSSIPPPISVICLNFFSCPKLERDLFFTAIEQLRYLIRKMIGRRNVRSGLLSTKNILAYCRQR
jgi:hypothetical protein